VAEDMDLTSLELITDNEGVEYAEISSKKDLMLFYNILKSDDRCHRTSSIITAPVSG